MNAIMHQAEPGHPDIEEATYSAEDNKLRLYPACRLDADLYQQVKAAGFKWAPRQELFVAPAWSPEREDLCIELAGEIVAEGTTLLERAQAKAARLDELSGKRRADSNAFHRAADQIAERFAGGQPILIGHHSERKARKDQERMHSAMDKAVKALETSNYWAYRAEGVEHHANMKNSDRTRANRIKKLLAELRGFQRRVNFAHNAIDLWRRVEAIQDDEKRHAAIKHYAGGHSNDGSMCGDWDTWGKIDKGEISPDDALQQGIAHNERIAEHPHYQRWIMHTLNRLAFERSELGEVPRFEEELTPAVLQTFAREQGADKPKAEKMETGDYWKLTSRAPLPAHICPGVELIATADQWRDLMRDSGHSPKTKAEKASGRAAMPILNFKPAAGHHVIKRMYSRGELEQVPVYELTKAEYSAIYKDGRGVRPSACGRYRFKITSARYIPAAKADGCGTWDTVAVFITDSKQHPAPEGL